MERKFGRNLVWSFSAILLAQKSIHQHESGQIPIKLLNLWFWNNFGTCDFVWKAGGMVMRNGPRGLRNCVPFPKNVPFASVKNEWPLEGCLHKNLFGHKKHCEILEFLSQMYFWGRTFSLFFNWSNKTKSYFWTSTCYKCQK